MAKSKKLVKAKKVEKKQTLTLTPGGAPWGGKQ